MTTWHVLQFVVVDAVSMDSLLSTPCLWHPTARCVCVPGSSSKPGMRASSRRARMEKGDQGRGRQRAHGEREKDERARKRKRSQLGLGVRLRVSVRRRTNKKKNRMLVDATQREEGNKKTLLKWMRSLLGLYNFWLLPKITQ